MRQKTYIVAVKSEKEDEVSPDWVEQLRELSGVQVRGGTRDQVRILADEEGIEHVRRALGGYYLIEEEVSRY